MERDYEYLWLVNIQIRQELLIKLKVQVIYGDDATLASYGRGFVLTLGQGIRKYIIIYIRLSNFLKVIDKKKEKMTRQYYKEFGVIYYPCKICCMYVAPVTNSTKK